jgi:hypothetical protein
MSGILEAVSFRDFWTEDQIRKLVVHYMEHAAAVLYPQSSQSGSATNHQTMHSLLIFSTSKQQTWLVANQLLLWCVLDDRRKEEPRVQWWTERDQVEPLAANPNYSPTSGVLHIGSRRKEWLFSKSLFQTVDVVDAVRQLLLRAAS